MKGVLGALPFLIVLFGTTELYLRYFVFDANLYRDNDCIIILRTEDAQAVERSRRGFRADCTADVSLSGGKTIRISTNEDGFRDRPRAEFASGVYAILGDSHVEGMGLSAEETLGRQLEAAGADVFHGKILNLGFRAAGTADGGFFLKRAVARYKVDGVIWLLTENDLLDDRLAFKSSSSGVNAFFLRLLHTLSAHVFRHRSVTLEYLQVLLRADGLEPMSTDEKVREKAIGAFCRNVRRAKDIVGKDVPYYVVAIPHGLPQENLRYFGIRIDREGFGEALRCIGEPPFRVIDLRAKFAELAPDLLEDRYHLNAEGTRRLAGFIVDEIRKRP